MKPYLLFEHCENSGLRKIFNSNELIEDLNLDVIFKAMAMDDSFLYNTVKSVVLNSLMNVDSIIYRQNVLKDCLKNKSAIKDVYNIASNTLKEAAYYRQSTQPSFSKMVSVSYKVRNSAGLLELLVVNLERLRSLTRVEEKNFNSKGMQKFCGQQSAFLTDEFFMKVKQHIEDLKFISEGGRIVLGSGIGNGMKGTEHILRKISGRTIRSSAGKKPGRAVACNEIPLDNISIANSAKEMEDAGLVHILRLINHFNDNILDYFELLRHEAGFYLACTNLYSLLEKLNVVAAFPIPYESSKRDLVFKELFDLSLFINEKRNLVGNDLDAIDKCLFIITGANQGGKSTWLRSIGIAQILMQCGMFVPAAFFGSNICDNIFTLFTREEDGGMDSGKLDEELQRMNGIINNMTNGSLLLMNEPFATTTERDGSIISRDIVTALYELDVKVIFVTHLFEFSDYMFKQNLSKAIYLRAERNDNGSRTFFIRTGKPLLTSFGGDIFNYVIGDILR
jgi:Mismatch repair ATPase (MutS family)